jgi:hypothetical protein
VRRLPERPAKLTAEMSAGELGRPGEVVHRQRLEVAGIGQVLGAQKVSRGRDGGHLGSMPA